LFGDITSLWNDHLLLTKPAAAQFKITKSVQHICSSLVISAFQFCTFQ